MDNEKAPEKRRCKGHNKLGKRCGEPPMTGRNYCRLHGGKNLKGLASVTYKTGKSIKYQEDLPQRLKQRYLAGRGDPELLELNNEIALAEAFLGDLITKMDKGESGRIWKLLEKTWNEADMAAAKNERAKFAVLFDSMGDIIKKGIAEYAIMEEIRQVMTLKKSLVESQVRKEERLEQSMKVDEVIMQMTLFAETIRDAVLENVTDQVIVEAILTKAAQALDKSLNRGNNTRTYNALPEG